MKPRTGRPPKQPTGTHTTLTLRIPATDKQLLIQMADGYDMTITEYILTLLKQDAKTP
jgi:uncharacterized protein (DUF1778 family)